MSEQVPLFGEQRNEPMKEFRTSPKRDLGPVFGVAVMVACVVAVFVIIKLVRFADSAESRLTTVELKLKVTELQAKVAEADKRVEAESQRLTGMMENHNKLVQALGGVFTAQESKLATLDAKVAAAEFARTNVVVQMDKPEEPKKEKKR